MSGEMWGKFIIAVIFIFRVADSSDLDYDDWSVVDKALFPSIPIAAPRSENRQCREDSRLLMAHLKNKTYWAMQMWDASGKTESGLLYGNVYQQGHFDECMLVKSPIEGQYCGITIKAIINLPDEENDDPFELEIDPLSIVWKKFKNSRADPSQFPRDNLTLGVCAPASCTSKDLNESINYHLQLLNSKAGPNDPTYVAISKEDHCVKQKPLGLTWSDICFWSVTAFLVGLQVFAAFFDCRRLPDVTNESRPKKLLMAFSFRRNFNYLFSSRSDEFQLKQLQILHAAKVISILMIVIDHRGAITFSSPIMNFQKYEEITRSLDNLFSFHGDLVVDSFFFIGGLLSCYSLLELYTKKFVNPLIIIFRRWVRLAPLYYMIVWFHSGVILSFGSGPIWNVGLVPEVKYCQKNWWVSLLFLNNYVNVDESCMIHSWYIPVDIHMFIIGIFIAIAITKNEKFGLTLLGSLTFLSILTPGIITAVNHIKPFILFYPEFFKNIRGGGTWQLLYIPTHARASVYLIGMITGYIIFKTKTSKKKMPRFCGTFLLFLCLGLLFAPMAYGSLYYNPRKPYNVIESAIFASLRRVSWALGCFVFMMVNCFDRTWILRAVSRAKFYMFLSKLAYSIYLIHFYMQFADRVVIRNPGVFSIYGAVLTGFGDFIFSVFYGMVFYLLVELPFKNLIHELLFAKVIERVKKEMGIQPNQNQSAV